MDWNEKGYFAQQNNINLTFIATKDLKSFAFFSNENILFYLTSNDFDFFLLWRMGKQRFMKKNCDLNKDDDGCKNINKKVLFFMLMIFPNA